MIIEKRIINNLFLGNCIYIQFPKIFYKLFCNTIIKQFILLIILCYIGGTELKKAKHILGLPIILLDTGEEIFDIKDILFSQKNKRLLGFLIDEGGWFKGAKIVLLKHVHTIGKDAVIIQNKKVIMSSTQIPDVEEVLEKKYTLFQLKVIDNEGNRVGRVEDVLFNEKTGHLHYLEVSEGVFEDIFYGRLRIPLSNNIKFEDKAIIITNKKQIKKIGGLKKYFNQDIEKREV